jgi:hypothetical protein
MLFGAAIGSIVKSIPLAIILAFLSHYFLDFIPHLDYHLKNTEKKKWIIMLPNISKISFDFFLGVLLIFLFSKNQPIIYLCAFLAIVPDGLTVLNGLLPNKILAIHSKLHIDKIHFLKDNKKISNFWRITGQVLVAIISVIILRV